MRIRQLALFDLGAQSSQDGDTGRKAASVRADLIVPAEIIVAAIELMGAIDLDPYSSSKTVPDVPAKLCYTAEDKGLTRPWGPKRRIFLHPPSRSTGKWVEKLCTEYEAGSFSEAIAFLKAALDREWWQRLTPYPICFVHGRLYPGGKRRSATLPLVVIYLGHNLDGFVDAFGDAGTIYMPLKQKPVASEPQISQHGRYVLTVHRSAAYFTVANPMWDARVMSDDQGRLRNAILKIPGVVPGRYNNLSRSREGTVKLVFSFKKGEAEGVISRVEALLESLRQQDVAGKPEMKRR